MSCALDKHDDNVGFCEDFSRTSIVERIPVGSLQHKFCREKKAPSTTSSRMLPTIRGKNMDG